jgi:hypothetical protein
VRQSENDAVPSRLRRLNWIFMTEADDRITALANLRRALLANIAWIREHTRLCDLATRWVDLGRKERGLLTGQDIDAAELWVLSRPETPETPRLTSDMREFVQESRRAQQSREERDRAQVLKTQRFQSWFGRALAGVAVLLVAGLVGVIWQDIRTTQREQAVIASAVDRAQKDERYDRAMRYARDHANRCITVEANLGQPRKQARW